MNISNENKQLDFLQELNLILAQNANNADFNINQLCKLMFMSRSSLHRKITTQTGKSTAIYIRDFRLNKAYRLIQLKNGAIKDIALAVGFLDMPYFCKCFKEKYGCTPSEVRR